MPRKKNEVPVADIDRMRDRIQKSVLQFSNYINEIATIATREISRADILQIESKLDRVLLKYDEFVDIHYQICDILGVEDDDRLKQFEDIYYGSTASAKALIEQNSNIIEVDRQDMPSEDPLCISKIKLPTITLPKFNGSPHQWLEFRDVFETLIHGDTSLSEIKKFYYLRSALEGDAKQLIQGIETSSANYSIAWKNLCERFENKRLLIQNHLSAIYNLPTINKESAVQMRDMLDKVNQHLRALSSLGQPVEHWDTMIIYIICNKLDPVTIREWETEQLTDKIPTLDALKIFLRDKSNMLESINLKRKEKNETNKYSNSKENKYTRSFVISAMQCYYCKKEHAIYACPDFLALDIDNRIKAVNERNLCPNCLRFGHTSKACDKMGCRKCHFKHNTLIHRAKLNNQATSSSARNTENNNNKGTVTLTSCSRYNPDKVLLATARVNVFDSQGQMLELRALIDPGSQSNFITKYAAERLGLQLLPMHIQVNGINQAGTNISHKCSLNFQSRVKDYNASIYCLVVNEITNDLPQSNFNASSIQVSNNLDLADPHFAVSNNIDLLFGASISWNLLETGRISLGPNMPVVLETKLGWIISGDIPENIHSKKINCFFNTIQTDLTKFWELEDIPTTIKLKSTEEQYCEDYFIKTLERNSSGRFIVSIPFKESPTKLGNSRLGAMQRFLSLEKRLNSNDLLKTMYVNFINEYQIMGHMTLANEDVEPRPIVNYYLPHHGVLKESSLTTKLRVVFDGSFCSDSGYSLNNIECVGPIVQNDLLSIIMRFRSHAIAIAADIEKMYRQVLIHPNDRNLQFIHWRENCSDSLKTFRLNTVTYGTASSAFLSTRCLIQLANENQCIHPQASVAISDDFYVDDLITGVDSLQEGQILCKQINEILQSGCFPLRKWTSNVPQVLNLVADSTTEHQITTFEDGETTKTLGLIWNPQQDCLQYSTNLSKTSAVTKRTILSIISKIFDPLGLIGACVIKVKIILQDLWLLKLDWNDDVPELTAEQWHTFYNDLQSLSNLHIPRHCILANSIEIQLHGFADASEKAYGACIYLRSINNSGKIETHLLCAKSKVAPLKTLTIPKLELCAALVLAKLTHKVLNSMRVKFDNLYLWSDSEIVLAWLRRETSTLKIFVGNRIEKIREYLPDHTWNHVASSDNPSDLISRGIMPSEIIKSQLWWHGPSWLCQRPEFWPKFNKPIINNVPELRKKAIALVNTKKDFIIDFNRFSSFSKLIRTVAYLLRFINNCIPSRNHHSNELMVIEIHYAEVMLVRIVQENSFPTELQALKLGKPFKSSKISNLCPFIDQDNLLRVGGRLEKSDLKYDAKHQILLPNNHLLTKMLFRHEHIRLGHAGPQLLLASIRDKYWPINGKNIARKTIHDCTICHHVKPVNKIPLMGILPFERVNQAFPFQKTGIDYAGPFLIKDKKGRGARSHKCYIAVFICFAVKSIHLEIVSDLTTEAFLAALRRFISRRGKPSVLWSDNGTNFVGAQSELRRIVKNLVENQSNIIDELAFQGITWKFIPANSPHFGGLWEAGVKGTKYHLKRIVGDSKLTFEEFNTVTCQIESILNSRPLFSLSSDPNDLEALTPGHFLIGRKLSALPDIDVTQVNDNRLSRFQLVQKIVQHFWQRWKTEYLQTLQVRSKWITSQKPLAIGNLVLICSENHPPLRWILGRVIETHAGPDGIIRVATLRTSTGILKRAVSKLYPLPNQDLDIKHT